MTDQNLIKTLTLTTTGMNRREAIAHLIELGVVSSRRCHTVAIRALVERLVKSGLGRCQAMHQAAITHHCSYATVRQAIYYKPKT